VRPRYVKVKGKEIRGVGRVGDKEAYCVRTANIISQRQYFVVHGLISCVGNALSLHRKCVCLLVPASWWRRQDTQTQHRRLGWPCSPSGRSERPCPVSAKNGPTVAQPAYNDWSCMMCWMYSLNRTYLKMRAWALVPVMHESVKTYVWLYAMRCALSGHQDCRRSLDNAFDDACVCVLYLWLCSVYWRHFFCLNT
jgi:hypothetical protein